MKRRGGSVIEQNTRITKDRRHRRILKRKWIKNIVGY
jgi:hypothetical protein